MTGQPDAYAALEARFTTWAESRPDVRALIVVGSRARADDHPADEWSDLDLIAFVTDAAPFLAEAGWSDAAAGAPILAFLDRTGGGDPEWFFTFEEMRDVDVVLAALPPGGFAEAVRAVVAARFSAVVARGMRVLVDRDGAFDGAPPPDAPRVPPPRAEFARVVLKFWHSAEKTAKKLRRGEVWAARQRCDGEMKALLVEMMAWHAQTRRGWGLDKWHEGRFVDEWADPRALAGLRDAYAHYRADDIARALRATMDLFRWLAAETAGALGYPYPAEIDARITAWVEARLSEV